MLRHVSSLYNKEKSAFEESQETEQGPLKTLFQLAGEDFVWVSGQEIDRPLNISSRDLHKLVLILATESQGLKIQKANFQKR